MKPKSTSMFFAAMVLCGTLFFASLSPAGPFGWFGGRRCSQRQSHQRTAVCAETVEAAATAEISASATSVKSGDKVTITWSTNTRRSVLGWVAESENYELENVSSSGSKEYTITEPTLFRIYAKRLFGSTYAEVGVDVSGDADDTDDSTDDTVVPVDGFTLSAIGIGSQFDIDDTLSLASRDHEIGAFLESQNGTWTLITDEVMAENHPAAFDAWMKVFEASGKSKPAVIWHNQGKVISIEEVAGKDKSAILAMAQAQIPVSPNSVVIRGRARPLGLLPTPRGKEWKGPRVSKILKPLSASECPSVDLSSQVIFYKNQVGGTCVLNSFCGACESAIYTAYGKKNCVELSPSFLANLTGGWNGTWASSAADAVMEIGNIPMADQGPSNRRTPSGAKGKAKNYRVLAVYGPPDSDSQGYLRAALNRGYVVCAGISVGSGFDTDSDGYISYVRGAGRGVNHEIRVVGWDQEKHRFKIANSWGKSWGVNGSAWLEDRFFNADTDMWVIVTMNAAPDYQFYSPVADDEKTWPWNRDDTTDDTTEVVLNPKITASATQIVAGDQAIVMWTNTLQTVLCTLNGQAVAINGQMEVYPERDATYSIIAYDSKGNTQASWVRIDVVKGVKIHDEPAVSPCANGQCPVPRESRRWIRR